MNSEIANPSENPDATQQPDIESEETQPDDESQENTTSPEATKLDKLLESINIAEELDDDKLLEISEDCFNGFQQDQQSRVEWEYCLDEWLKLAKQTKEEKSYPWPKASNVKYPLLSTAAMQFAARAYPSLIPSDNKVVKGRVIGKDPTGEKQLKAERVALYMSYQLTDEMDGWEEDMDKLLIMLPVVGTVFKKTYWDKRTGKNCSHVIHPKNLIVNYWAKSLKEAERVSEIIEMSPRLVKERQLKKIFRDVDLGDAPTPDNTGTDNIPANDATTPYILIEQHTYIDLDDDGYPEPYIVTFHKDSKEILRITARWDSESLETNDKGKTIGITPVNYYTKFGFVPNPDGGFYDIGFGVLLGSLNESVNTLINQLIDAGSLSNLQGGFIGKGLRMRMGEHNFRPGEWKTVNATGDDLKKQIVPLPAKDPSDTLFKLMGSLITSGKELASVAEIFVGKMPGQNTPATTTMATIEQGMKVFTAVYKRLYRSLTEEYRKLYRLNRVYSDPQTYSAVLDSPIGPDDFSDKLYDVIPAADPSAISQTERLMKAQGLMELMQLGTLDPVEVTKRILQAQEQPNWEQVLNKQIQQTGEMPPPQPDPKVMALQAKAQTDQQAAAQSMQINAQQAELDSRDKQQKIELARQLGAQKVQDQAVLTNLKAASQQHADQAKIASAASQHAQDLAHNEQAHQQKMVQMKTAAKTQPKGK